MKNEKQENILLEIDSLDEIKREWQKKKNALRLAEAKQSDVNQLHQINMDIESIDKKLKEIDSECQDLQTKLKSISQDLEVIPVPVFLNNESDLEDEFKTIEIFKQEIAQLSINSVKNDFSKLLNIKSKLSERLFLDLDLKINFIASKKPLVYTSTIFDKIYSNPSLEDTIRQEIQKIREDKETYKYYDRSIIVSALSLSLINFKFDKTKANLLIDFITDFEDHVWERALTGLMLVLMYQNNGWYRYDDFRKRLGVLKEFDQVQSGIKIIDTVLKNKLYQMNIFILDLYENEHFQNPMNCFVPYYKDNNILNELIENAGSNFDSISFEEIIYDLPVMDIIKYYMTISFSQNQDQQSESKKENQEKTIKILQHFEMNKIFSPYKNLLSEYYYFFSHFPEKFKTDVFKNEFVITNTKLKDIILNKVMELLLIGNSNYHSKEYNLAIQKFKSILKIEQNNIEALIQIGNCFWELNKYDDAIKSYSQVENLKVNVGRDILFRIASCYYHSEIFDKALQYCEKIESLDIKPSFNFLILKAECYSELQMPEKALKICNESEHHAIDEIDFCRIAQLYSTHENNHKALKFAIKSVELKNDFAEGFRILGNIYSNLFDWEKAINSYKKALNINKKNVDYQVSLGRAYLLSNFDIKQGEILLLKGAKVSNEGIIFGNLGHLYLIKNDIKNATLNYKKCINLLKDEKEFIRRCNLDTKFITKLGISEQYYIEVRDNIVVEYLNSK